ncbi:sigma-70 family RNA polymerase sigma factor [Actinoplanes sp. NPDC051494]|uniref:sigma-70 family RNA polymerase sigma factor n=1 Tax=Actinoplanes sp. NPDC051494 TaxID=3363907 RepID=UPI0037BA212F
MPQRLSSTAAPDRHSADVTELFRDHRPALMRFLTSLARGHRHTAEDLFQETMLRTWNNIDSVPDDHDERRRWLFTVARRIVIDDVRRRQVRPREVGIESAHHLATADETSATAIANGVVLEAFLALSTAHRQVITDVYFRGRSIEQVAQDLDVPRGTVWSRIHYAVRALRETLYADVA